MASLQTLIVLEQSQVSPPPATVGTRVLPLTFFDFQWLPFPPVHTLFFYELEIPKTQFIETIVPHLKKSLSIALRHFFSYAGNLILFRTPTKKPEIRYVEGDSVVVTSAECNLDFIDLTRNHPRSSNKFYPLIPLLKCTTKVSDFITILLGVKV
ncbi:hypothetical protein L2E82_18362 [Cichorium intybus]|uniref:Uncharacterized protein n=1 Tax=Cichorium intybus TaxID=13427 RepID=A0ACB9F993_CICIN|nr:hypothetical protein L2E82_18362 [Cichorium intybus]